MDFSWSGLGDAARGVFDFLGQKEAAKIEAQRAATADALAQQNAALAFNSQVFQTTAQAKTAQTIGIAVIAAVALVVLMRVRPTAN